MAGYIGSKSSVTQVDGYSEAEADAEFVNDPSSVITVDGSNVGIGTSSPSTALAVNSGTSNNVATFTSTDSYALIKFEDNDTTTETTLGALDNDMVFRVGAAERMRIDSSGKVGIGETSPLGKLHIKGSDTGATASAQGNSLVLEDLENGLSILSSTAGAGYINFGDSGDNNIGMIVYDHSANALKTFVNASERMRIDSSGNVLVGTTNVDPSFGTTTGSSLQPSGQTHHSSSGTSLILNRTASDGTIAQFRKGGTTVGSIGAVSGQVYMADTAAGLRFSGQGADDVSPCNGSGADKDNSVDLGQTSNRFKDVHAVNYYGDGANLTGVGGSTAYGAVGTYVIAGRVVPNDTLQTGGYTFAGSSLKAHQATGTYPNAYAFNNAYHSSVTTSAGLSGTWRLMAPRMRINSTDTGRTMGSLWVRIS